MAAMKIVDVRLRIDTDDPITMPLAGEEIARLMRQVPTMPNVLFLGGHVSEFTPPKVKIMPNTHRGVDGFLVMSSAGDRIFTRTRDSAERIRDRIRNGEETRLEDYEPRSITRIG